VGGEAAKTDIRKQNFGCEHRGLKGATYFAVGSYRSLPKGAQREPIGRTVGTMHSELAAWAVRPGALNGFD
jgi:hypothetical protein